MLEYFRNAAKSWIAKGLLGILAIAFGVWGITDVFRGGGVKDLATVGGRTITGADFSQAISRAQQRLQQQNGVAVTLDEMRKQGLDVQIRDGLISTAAIDDIAHRLGIVYSPKAIAQESASNPAFQNSSGVFDPAIFRRVLDANGIAEDSYVRSEMELRTRSAITNNANAGPVPKTFGDAMHRFIDETRDVRYFIFQVNEQTAPQPSEDELKKQYESTPAAYTAPEYRAVAILKADPGDVATKYEVSDAELKNGFDKYKDEYATPEKRTYVQVSFPTLADAQKAKARVDKGEDLMKIAEELKFKPADITFTLRTKVDLLDAKIADATFALAPNTVSAPVEGALATALVKVTDIVPGTTPTLDGIKADLTKRLQLKKAAEDIQNVYDSVEEMRSNQSKFEDIAAKLNLPITIVPAVSASGLGKDGKRLDLPGDNDLLKAVYDGDVGVEADALNVNQGYVWFDVREVIPSTLKPFDQVKDQVKTDWVAAHMRGLAEKKSKELVDRANAGGKIEDLAKEMNATVKDVTAVHRNQSTPELDGLATLAVFGAPEKAFTYSLESDGKSARLMQVANVSLPPLDDKSDQTKKINEQLKQQLTADITETFMTAARTSAKVTMNDALWQQIAGGGSAQ
jgi:peptidyl-prolyl cis-trans isomerase D